MKLKTHKATAKRLWRTPKGKVMRRKSGQDHFNARESGKTTRNKRRDQVLAKGHAKNVVRFIPYNG